MNFYPENNEYYFCSISIIRLLVDRHLSTDIASIVVIHFACKEIKYENEKRKKVNQL